MKSYDVSYMFSSEYSQNDSNSLIVQANCLTDVLINLRHMIPRKDFDNIWQIEILDL